MDFSLAATTQFDSQQGAKRGRSGESSESGHLPSGPGRAPFHKCQRTTLAGYAAEECAAVECRSTLTSHINYVYSYAEEYDVVDWMCDACGARFVLCPTSPLARGAHGIVEIAVHQGEQWATLRPGVCSCGVAWVPWSGSR